MNKSDNKYFTNHASKICDIIQSFTIFKNFFKNFLEFTFFYYTILIEGLFKMEVMLLVSFKIQENELKKYMIDISKGNELALEQFYEKYGQLLLALIYSIVKNRESSEEALQDVLMAIVNRNADNPMENARGWLFKVTENISKKKVKEDKLMHSESLSDYEDTLIGYDMTSNIEETVDQIEAIKILDEFEQEILIMCVFGQMKLPYIAESLNMPYDKVRSKYDYAIRKLKRYYGGRKKV